MVRFSFDAAEGIQSTLDTGGGAAQSIEQLGLVLLIGASVILLLVIGLLLYGALSAPKRVTQRRWVIGGGLVFPVMVLSALLAYTLFISNELTTPPPAESPEIRVIGKRWWWEVRYRQPNGETVSANEIHLPVGRSVEIALSTAAVRDNDLLEAATYNQVFTMHGTVMMFLVRGAGGRGHGCLSPSGNDRGARSAEPGRRLPARVIFALVTWAFEGGYLLDPSLLL